MSVLFVQRIDGTVNLTNVAEIQYVLTTSNTAYDVSNTAYNNSNTAYNISNTAYDTANSALAAAVALAIALG